MSITTVDGTALNAGIKRKPVATPFAGPVPNKELEVVSSSHLARNETMDSLPPRATYLRQPSVFARLQRKWLLLSQRTRIIMIVSVVVALGLIIGLPAGLAEQSPTSNLPLPNDHGGPYTGDLTYYDPALGACGITSTSADSIVSISHFVFDAVQVGGNPNTNPLCNKKIRAQRDGKSIDLTVVDRCTGCNPTDIDTTTSVFSELAQIDQGRVTVEWSWLEAVPPGAVSS